MQHHLRKFVSGLMIKLLKRKTKRKISSITSRGLFYLVSILFIKVFIKWFPDSPRYWS